MNVFRLCQIRKQAEMVVAATITDMGEGRPKEEDEERKNMGKYSVDALATCSNVSRKFIIHTAG